MYVVTCISIKVFIDCIQQTKTLFKMTKQDMLIESYKVDIKDLQKDINRNGTTPAATRTLNRLKEKLRKLELLREIGSNSTSVR